MKSIRHKRNLQLFWHQAVFSFTWLSDMKGKKTLLFTTGICLLLFTVPVNAQETPDAAASEPEPEPVTWSSYWSNGYKFKSSDGRFKLKFGGRIMNDWVAAFPYEESVEDYAGKLVNGTEFRRVRFFNSGTVYGIVSYKLQLDFAGGDADFKDVWIRINDIPGIGHFKVGHYKEPFGLEELTSSKYITFMARALTSPFQPSRNTGFMAYNHALDKRLTWAVGTFMDAGGYGESSGSSIARFNVTGRVTGLPWADLKNNKLLHVGAAYQYRNPDGDTISYDSEPETHQQPDFANTGDITGVSAANIVGGELALVTGPYSVQGEYQMSALDRSINMRDTTSLTTKEKGVSTNFSAFYVYTSVFLTKGDHRFYDPGDGAFGRMKPQKNFREDGGIGAIELAVRYSALNLIDGKSEITDGAYLGSSLVAGGQLSDITVGLNWYLSPNTRIMLNYVYTDVSNAGIGKDPDNIEKVGNAGFFRTRFQIDF